MRDRELALLLELLHQPTAPFREQHVVEFVTSILRTRNIPFFLDPVGNVVVGCASPKAYRAMLRARTTEPVRLYMAHMDHPGFHGVRWLGRDQLRVKWHGGAPTRGLRGARVWIADADSNRYEGRLLRARLTHDGRTIDTADVQVAVPNLKRKRIPNTLYGGLRFRAPVWRAGRRLYTHVADDLIGVFATVATAVHVYRKRGNTRASFLGLLTRAEEVGFIGAVGHFTLGWLARSPRPVICVSLETSRTLPNAVIGKGPVVRLGDRRTVFDPGALNVLMQVARRTLAHRHQRRIMDGGTCEATAATVHGLTAIGISVPLGNYHNQGFEGGPDCRGRNAPAPEFVHLDDVDGLLTLCRGLLRQGLAWRNPWATERRRYRNLVARYRTLI
jgi:putative aminopeptidase FrvX